MVVIIIRSVIPRRKGATVLHVQVGINNPEVRASIVDAKHVVCSTAMRIVALVSVQTSSCD